METSYRASATMTTEPGMDTKLAGMQQIIRKFPEVIYVSDPKTHEVILVNDNWAQVLGRNPVGEKCHKAFQGLDEPCPFCTNETIAKSSKPYNWEYYNPSVDRHFFISDQMIDWPDGRKVRFEVAIDITDKVLAEKERDANASLLAEKVKELDNHKNNLEQMVQQRTAELKNTNAKLELEIQESQRRAGIIRQQAEDILELSTPVMQVWEGVLLAPLIGNLDSNRAQHFMEVLLDAVATRNAEVVIIDITGVGIIDTETGRNILETFSAIGLLGAKVILTGVRASVAQTLVHLGVDLSAIETRSSLKSGLQYAMSTTSNGAFTHSLRSTGR